MFFFHPNKGFLFCWRTAVADNHTKVLVLGKGDGKFLINRKIVQVPDCLYIPSLSPPLYSIRHHRHYAAADNDGCTLTFTEFIVPVDDSKDCLISIQPISPKSRVEFNASSTQKSTMRREIEDIAKDNITVVNIGEIPIEIGDTAKIKGSRQSKEPIPRPPTTLHSMHAKIGYGNSIAPGGIKYILILVDRKSHYCWVYGLKGISGEGIKAAFCKFKIEAGTLPKNLYTDYDKKIIKGKCKEYLEENHVCVTAATSGR
eukprot:457651-Ditylum_brightwellii.AAC.2